MLFQLLFDIFEFRIYLLMTVKSVYNSGVIVWQILFVFLLFPFVMFAEDFSSSLVRQVDPLRKNTIALVCTDSLELSSKETVGEVNVMRNISGERRIVEKMVFRRADGAWKLNQRLTNARIEALEVGFYDFLERFCLSRELQIEHTIFPLPITSRYEKDGSSQKKLLMPRDWEELKITQQCAAFYSIQPQRQGNNRKVYIYHRGQPKESYNFIYINKLWYLIEMEIYL